MNEDDYGGADYQNDFDPTEHLSFNGPCTCNHETEEHGFLGCLIDDCNCEAHWEE